MFFLCLLPPVQEWCLVRWPKIHIWQRTSRFCSRKMFVMSAPGISSEILASICSKAPGARGTVMCAGDWRTCGNLGSDGVCTGKVARTASCGRCRWGELSEFRSLKSSLGSQKPTHRLLVEKISAQRAEKRKHAANRDSPFV